MPRHASPSCPSCGHAPLGAPRAGQAEERVVGAMGFAARAGTLMTMIVLRRGLRVEVITAKKAHYWNAMPYSTLSRNKVLLEPLSAKAHLLIQDPSVAIASLC